MAAVWTMLGVRSASLTQALTESAPTPGAQGLLLSSVAAILPVIRPEVGQTLTGTGSLLGYVYVGSLGRWVRAPRIDADLSDMSGLSEAVLSSLSVLSPREMMTLVASSVGVSGGATCTVDFYCVDRNGAQI